MHFQKKFKSIFLKLLVIILPLASLLSVASIPSTAKALACDSQVFVGKTQVSRNEEFKVFASASTAPGVGCPYKDKGAEKGTFIISFWDSDSSLGTASQLYNVELEGRYTNNNPDLSVEAGQKFKAVDIIQGLKATDTKDLYVYVKFRVPGTSIESGYFAGSGQKISVVTEPLQNQETTIIDDKDAQSKILKVSVINDDGIIPGDNTSGCLKYITSSVEVNRKEPQGPIKMTVDTGKPGSSLGLNFFVTLTEEARVICKPEVPNIKFSIWAKYPHETNNPQDSYQGYQILIGGISSQELLDESKKFIGFKSGKDIVPGAFLNAEEKQKVLDGEEVSADIRVTFALQDGDFVPSAYDGIQVGDLVPVSFTKDETAVTPVTEGFEQINGVALTSGNGGENGAVTITDFIAQVIGSIMWFIVAIIYNIFSIVIAPLIEISLAIHTYTDDFAKVILPGWELLRNLSNIFFIVILLAIGLATLFRVQKYQYRNLLLKLILAALLVNFSMVITQSVLAIAETVQSQFLPIEKNDDVVRTIAKSIMFAPFEQGTITPEVASKSLSESLSRLVFPFFYLSLSLMGFVVMGALAILLVVRFAVIWILLMTSPIAFVAWVLPATSKYTDQWLDNLFRYAFFVAIIGFFLNVIAFLAQRQGGVFQDLTDAQVTGWDGFLSRIATNLMILIFMIVAMGAAQSMKIAGGKYVSKIGQAAGKLPWKGLKAIGERGFEGVQNKTRLTLDPRIWKKDAEDYMAKLNDAKEGRLAKRRDAFILGSPKDFMNTFGTPDGIKKVGRSIKAKMKYNADAEKALRAQQDILTEDKRKENTDKQSKSEAKVRGLIGKYKRLRAKKMDQALDKDDIDSIQKTIKSRTESLNTEIADLTAKAEELKKNGGDPKTIAKIQATRDEKIKQRNAIDKTAKDLETQITAGGAIDLTAIRGIDKVFDSEEAAQQARDLLKAERGDFVKLRRTSKKDDALRTANGFDAYNATPPPGYKAFTEADSERVKKQYQDIEILNAQRKANSRNYQDQYDRRKQGEKTKELEESGIEESRQWLGIYHKAEAEGDKNTAVAAMKWLAKDGSFGDLLKSKNKGVDYNGMVSFFKEDFKPKFKIDDQSLFRLGAEIGKINEGKKQFTLSKVVSVGLNGPSGWKDESAYMSDLGKKLGTAEPRELTKMHKYAFMNEGVDGKGRVHEAGQNALESLRTSEDVKSIKGGMSIATAKSIIGSSNYANLRLSPEIRRALEERAAKSRVK